mgnify:FL=1
MLEILEDRYRVGSTIVTGQRPIEPSHEVAGDPIPPDAIFDRFGHNAHRLGSDVPVERIVGSSGLSSSSNRS